MMNVELHAYIFQHMNKSICFLHSSIEVGEEGIVSSSCLLHMC